MVTRARPIATQAIPTRPSPTPADSSFRRRPSCISGRPAGIRALALAAAAQIGILASACSESEIAAAPPTAVQVEVVARAARSAATRYSAQIEPGTQVDLAFKVGGYVTTMTQVAGVDGTPRVLQEGDTVEIGTELASVRKTDYEQKLREARAAVAQASAAAEQARIDFERTEKLAASGTASPAQLDAARIRRDGAAASLLGARVRAEEAETLLADTSLRAPISGVIVRRWLEVGALAAQGAVAFTVAKTDRVKVVFGVPDTVLPRIRLGATQVITTESFRGAQFEGQITRIAPTADARSRVFEVEVTIDNSDQRLKSGMVAALALVGPGADAADAPLVPLSAIVRSPNDPDGFAVFVVSPPASQALGAPPESGLAVRAVDVELGEYLGNFIPVRSGLSGGEQIVVTGAALLADGERIQVIP